MVAGYRCRREAVAWAADWHPGGGAANAANACAIANPTVADAILDRLVHNAHRLTLKGDSLRKAAAKRTGLDDKKPS